LEIKNPREEKLPLSNIGKRAYFRKLIKKGDCLHYYLIDLNGRNALLMLLDKNPADSTEKFIIK
jgi:hypothetical protein